MLLIATSAALARALDSPIDPRLKSLLSLRRDQLAIDGVHDIGDIARFVIAQSGDLLEAVEAELGFPIATNVIDGSQYPDPCYQPNWEWCIRRDGLCWEAPFILSDDGAGVVLITLEQEGVDLSLLRLCHDYGTIENDA